MDTDLKFGVSADAGKAGQVVFKKWDVLGVYRSRQFFLADFE